MSLEKIMRSIRQYQIMYFSLLSCYFLLKSIDIVITPLKFYNRINPDDLEPLIVFQKSINVFLFGPIKIVLSIIFYKMADKYLMEFFSDSEHSLLCAKVINWVMRYSIATYVTEFLLKSVSVIGKTYLDNKDWPVAYDYFQNVMIGYSKRIMYIV